MATTRRVKGDDAPAMKFSELRSAEGCFLTLGGQRGVTILRQKDVSPDPDRVLAASGRVRVTLLDGTEWFSQQAPYLVDIATGASFRLLRSTKKWTRIWGATTGTYAGMPFADLSPDGQPVNLLYLPPGEDGVVRLRVYAVKRDAAPSVVPWVR